MSEASSRASSRTQNETHIRAAGSHVSVSSRATSSAAASASSAGSTSDSSGSQRDGWSNADTVIAGAGVAVALVAVLLGLK